MLMDTTAKKLVIYQDLDRKNVENKNDDQQK